MPLPDELRSCPLPDKTTLEQDACLPPTPTAPLRVDTLFKFFSAALLGEAEGEDGEWELTLALRPWSQRGWCWLRVYELSDGRPLVLLTDLGAANPGPAVEEVSGDIATQACLSYGMDPADALFIEHTDERHDERHAAHPLPNPMTETFAWVRYARLGPHLFDAERRRAEKTEIEAFLGQKLP